MSVGLDYLRITVFEQLEGVRDLVEGQLLERGGLPLTWVERGCVGRWGEIWDVEGSEGYLVQIRAPIACQSPYTMVELKGEGCFMLQNELQGFLRAVDSWASRWSGKRADYRWDGHAITPLMMKEAVEAGQFVSRSLSVADRDWRENAKGQTCYLGGRSNVRHVRDYNARGFNRLELECSEDSADALLRRFIEVERDEWSRVALGFLLATVDFRDVGARSRVHRAPRLPWWDKFVGDAEKVKNFVVGDEVQRPFAPLPIGLADDWLRRNRKTLRKMIEALGPEWIAARVRYWSRADVETEKFAAEVERLKVYRGSGLCGTDDLGDLPI